MSDFVSGFVDEIPCRQTNFGEAYDIVVNGETYGFGKFAPKFGVGSEIEFDISWNGKYANVDRDTVNVINLVAPARGGNSGGRGAGNSRGGYQGGQQRGGGQGGSRGGAPQGGGSRQGGSMGGAAQRQGGGGAARQGAPSARPAASSQGKDGYWEAKEQRDIVTQKAIQYQSSRNAAIELVSAALTAGAVALPAAKAKQWDALLALVDTVTERFEEAVLVVRGEGGKKTKPAPEGRGKQKVEDEGDVPFDDELPDWSDDEQGDDE